MRIRWKAIFYDARNERVHKEEVAGKVETDLLKSALPPKQIPELDAFGSTKTCRKYEVLEINKQFPKAK